MQIIKADLHTTFGKYEPVKVAAAELKLDKPDIQFILSGSKETDDEASKLAEGFLAAT